MEFFLRQVFLRKYRRAIALIISALLGLGTALTLPALSSEKAVNPVQLEQQGREFYEAGQLGAAAKAWQEAANAYEAAGDRERMTESLLNRATVQQALGLYPKSCQTILQAYGVNDLNCQGLIAKTDPLERQLEKEISQDTPISSLQPLAEAPASPNKATALLRLGDFFRQRNDLKLSREVLLLSLETAEQLNSPQAESAVLLSLGNTARAIANREQAQFPPPTVALDVALNQQSSVEAALAPYQKAIDYYEQSATRSQLPQTRIQAQLNYLSLLVDIDQFWQQATAEAIESASKSTIDDPIFRAEIVGSSQKLQSKLERDIRQKTRALTAQIQPQLDQSSLSRAAVYNRINFAQNLIRLEGATPNVVQLLATAAKDARTLKNSPAQAQALGLLGQVYEQNGQLLEAQKLTEEALRLAPASENPEIAYLWERQLGRILNAEGDTQGAIAAYDVAFNTIQALRSDLAATTSVEPIYREFVSLLLQSDPDQQNLNKARRVLESLQIAEIDNFFRDPCSTTASELVQIDDVDRQAAVIYPIILSDRIEVIFALPGQDLRHYQTRIDKREVEDAIEQLRSQALSDPQFPERLRGARGNPQQQQSLQKDLQQTLDQDILPLANQMYNWLLAPVEADLAKSGVKTLVFVLDGVLRNIPMALLYDGQEYLIEKDYNVALSLGLQLTAPQPLTRQSIKVLAAGVTRELPQLGLPPIPKVEQELKLIKQIFADSEVLLDEEFTKLKLQEVLEESTFPVVHLATHGRFSSTPERTFIVSGDKPGNDLINVKDLENLLRAGSPDRSIPIELLVLSACNTAEGDNQAILGLAGVAVRAGARSTLATLWGANDEATAELMGYFYRNLATTTQANKAKALRDAQLALLKAPGSQYKHPYYWSPFVLVGNWL
ncbi:CHAT domain-containing protein [Pleurocapsales cyanobacterium LEGE 06147]|nr:CHAT domain-containing protein [Pleurocapsales cyanobacterium LEGE 06147]